MKKLKRVTSIYFSFLPTISILLILNSCVFINLQQDLDKLYGKGTIYGRVVFSQKDSFSNIIVVVDKDRTIVAYKRMHPDDFNYVFMLPPNQKYQIFAYHDMNSDKLYDKSEPVGKWLNSKNIIVKPGESSQIPDIIIKSNVAMPQQYVTTIDEAGKKQSNNMIIRAGAIADIKNKIFDSAHGVQGLWTPVKMFEEVGAGVYFLEKYDSKRIPILFIHGISGYPQAWEPFFKKIDHDKFQIWFYHYPSGYNIKDISETLDEIMAELHSRYKFKQLYIVSHSMGGLVVAGFIINTVIKNTRDYLKLFIALSTPWSGSDNAAFGVKYAPSVVPSWNDLKTGSKYINFIHKNNWEERVSFYNLFSYRGNAIPYNDGAVTLKSQLYLPIQQKAIKSLGFDCTHREMLFNKDVIESCNKLFLQYSK